MRAVAPASRDVRFAIGAFGDCETCSTLSFSPTQADAPAPCSVNCRRGLDVLQDAIARSIDFMQIDFKR